MVGRILGDRYRVLSRLGEGGMGTVYLCEHAVLGRRYAVKVLRPDLGGDPELVERFRNEAIAASRIGGDHVVDVLDFGAEEDGALYYVMEALEGWSLGAILAREGPLEVDRALGLLEQVCRALGAAHARGVVHRDVKPDNVFVVRGADGAERAKVIDFGVSRVCLEGGQERLTRAGAIIGTPEYMAPEQAAGDPVDHRADVYAVGVLAYEILTGTLPIVAHTPVATLVAHQTRTPEPPSRRRPSVPPEVDALVLGALAKLPGDRPQTMEALAEGIVRILGRAVPGTPRSAERTRMRSRDTVALPEASRPFRTATLRALAAAALVLGAVGAAWWASRPGAPVMAGTAPETKAAATPANPATPPAASQATARPASGLPPTERSPETAPAPDPAAASAAAPGSTPPRRKRPAQASRAPRRDDPHLQDPYAAGGLKSDPFQ
jgi:serine/threonine-protein kinase